ncbi:MAG: aminopeptidase P family N-terminal domain-containing protein, partial [bacterium]
MTAVEKIRQLRIIMKARGVAAMVIPSTDPHQGEYVGPHWRAREWVSGFTGSAGTLVLTLRHAGLWTDGRYFIQAELELRGSGIRLFKGREPGVPAVNEWIAGQLQPGQVVALDGRLVSMDAVREMKKAFAGKTLRLRVGEDLVGRIWQDRPLPACTTAFDFPVKFTGQGRAAKLAAVRKGLRAANADGLLLASLDDIAWLFNIRGHDIAHSPVVQAFALVGMKHAVLFVNPAQIPGLLARKLAAAGVICRPYSAVVAYLKTLTSIKRLSLNARRINQVLANALPKSLRLIESSTDITSELKAVRNPVEQVNVRHAALLDGLALVRFLAWVERTLEAGGSVTEYEAGVRLEAIRKESPEYQDDSFSVICGYGANAAMIHYSAGIGNAVKLRRKGLFLVDSGGNYFEGTMDTTRTVSLGAVPWRARRDFTLVLKGLIALTRARFPAGTTGTHLDAIVRAPLWAQGADFKHGSGHGVGSYLNVHEGPQGISSHWNAVALKSGMVVTIEP